MKQHRIQQGSCKASASFNISVIILISIRIKRFDSNFVVQHSAVFFTDENNTAILLGLLPQKV
eukprot:scaffold464513_cov13-Prasinocladus_malaysianus.AAC.1